MTAWLEVCDAAAFRTIPTETAAICRALVSDSMQDAVLAESILPTLLRALRKMQPSTEHMTPFHAAVLQAYASDVLVARLCHNCCDDITHATQEMWSSGRSNASAMRWVVNYWKKTSTACVTQA